MTIFDSSLKRLLIRRNTTVEAATPHGSIDIELCEPPKLQLGRLDIDLREPVGCANLSSLGEVIADDVAGIVGMDVLSRQIVHLDFDEGTLSFLKSQPEWWEALLPIEGTAQAPMVRVGLQTGCSMPCLIDTGCLSVGGLNRQVFNALESRNFISPLGKTISADLCRVTEQRVALLPRMDFGNYRMPAAVVGDYGGPNLLGLHFWSRFNVTFDFPRGALYLKPNSNFSLSERDDRSGLHIFRRRGQFIVDRIEPRSPAGAADIDPCDRVLTIDGQPVDELSLASFRALLCQSGKRMRLTLQRGERQIAAMLTLRGDRQGPPAPYRVAATSPQRVAAD